MKQRREPYAKLYASWHSHPRTGPLSLAAGGLEARMMSWSVAHGTDGLVPRELLSTVAGPASKREVASALEELIRRGVVNEMPDGSLAIRDFLDANISKERDEERRANQVERQNRSRGRKSVTRDDEPVTRDKGVSHTPSLDHDHDHDHDGGEAPPPDPPETLLRDRVVHRWRVTFEAARGQFPTADDTTARAVVEWLLANERNADRTAKEILDDVLAAYWREPWPRDRANRPSLRNFLSQADRLLALGATNDAPKTVAPEAYDPRKHGDLGHLGGAYRAKHNLLLDVGPKHYDDELAKRRIA